MMHIQIIYTQDDVLLSKQSYASWQEIQKEFELYKASLGPWPIEEVIKFLADEYSNLVPPAQEQVNAFIQSKLELCKLTFTEFEQLL